MLEEICERVLEPSAWQAVAPLANAVADKNADVRPGATLRVRTRRLLDRVAPAGRCDFDLQSSPGENVLDAQDSAG